MNRKKKGVKPRKPIIRPVASRKVELPQVEISVSDEQRRACDEMTRMAQEWGHEGSRDAADPAGSSHRARSASEAEPALRCEASARGVRRQVTTHEPV